MCPVYIIFGTTLVCYYGDKGVNNWHILLIDYVACARDGWGTEEISDTSGTLHIQAWLLDSCKKKFSKSFMMDKNNINTTFPTEDNVKFDSSYSLTSTIVSVQVRLLSISFNYINMMSISIKNLHKVCSK